MTGFERPNRSFYLDDMEVTEGETVMCLSCIASESFTEGKAYVVHKGKTLMTDQGNMVKPSARFTYLEAA